VYSKSKNLFAVVYKYNTLSEAETQSILTHHLFGPLVPSSKYIIDGRHRHEKKCFACKENIVLGNTSIGKSICRECPCISPFLKNNGPPIFKEWRVTWTFSYTIRPMN
jgi:hypothetical protein